MNWKDFAFEQIITDDQSPTLKPIATNGAPTEHMHHRGGAYSESVYIYSPVFDLHAELSGKAFVSVGLGLGYNEFLWSQKTIATQTTLFSFERNPDLQELFVAFLKGELPDGEVKDTYEMVAKFFPPEARENLRNKLGKTLILKTDFSLQSLPNVAVHGFIYDAYSSKVSPELWQEDFLKKMLAQIAADDCVFSTYSCTSRLKNTLIEMNFQVDRIKGFQSKKHSVLARRQEQPEPLLVDQFS